MKDKERLSKILKKREEYLIDKIRYLIKRMRKGLKNKNFMEVKTYAEIIEEYSSRILEVYTIKEVIKN